MMNRNGWGAVLILLAGCGDSAPDTSGTADARVVSDASALDAGGVALDPLTCAAASGGPAGAVYTYTTTGGWRVTVNRFTVTLARPGDADKIESWGAGAAEGTQHENLNGKHIKDWIGTTGRRTFRLPDGAVVTLRTCPGHVLAFASVYDGAHTRRVSAETNAVLFSSDDAAVATRLEALEADGETARVYVNDADGVSYENIHEQTVLPDGSAGPVVPGVLPLGETGGPQNPTRVRDYYDDPRLGHT